MCVVVVCGTQQMREMVCLLPPRVMGEVWHSGRGESKMKEMVESAEPRVCYTLGIPLTASCYCRGCVEALDGITSSLMGWAMGGLGDA